MTRKIKRQLAALLATTALLQPAIVPTASANGLGWYMPYSSDAALRDFADGWGAGHGGNPSGRGPWLPGYGPGQRPSLPPEVLTALLRQRIKYVFVIFNENHSFDNEFGTFPGANGLYSDGMKPRLAANTPGFTQTYKDAAGNTHTVQPFRLGPAQNSTVVDSVDHGHNGLAAKLAVNASGVPTMSGFSQDEYTGKAGSGTVTAAGDAKGQQFANLVMSYVDCDTIPFMWQWANRFTLFDNIYATEDTPSTPNAIAMIAGQSGETQWVKHADKTTGQIAGTTKPLGGTINGVNFAGTTGTTQAPPIVNDPNPYWGSEFDPANASHEPTSPKEFYGSVSNGGASTNVASNLTFATVPLTAAGNGVRQLMAGDHDATNDQADIQKDIPFIAAKGKPPLPWRWYENGYDVEPTDGGAAATHGNYVAHHDGPAYFGYIANNANEQTNLRGENDFFQDIASGDLPSHGVFYIRGGFNNIQGLKVPIQNPNYPNAAGLSPTDITSIQTAKNGDDDHPAYSDRQISEAMSARVINAIAANPRIWSQSAIIVTYDESDGFYDHVPPRILSYGPDGKPLSRGIRVPMIVISPYSRSHAVLHAEGDHNAVIETINTIFGLPPLSSLPDEAQALKDGDSATFNQFGPAGFHQKYLGPRDTNSDITDDLISAFDPDRLLGRKAPLPASLAMIPDAVVNKLPHYDGNGCQAIGIVPEDKAQGISTKVPAGFNTLPSTLPAYNVAIP